MRDADARDRAAKLEALLEELESLEDPVARDRALGAVRALVELYGAGLERIVAEVAERDTDGALAEALAGDELVSHLLLLHDLHPVPLDARVRGALAEVRPYLESHGGDVELLGIDDGVVRLRFDGSCSGCPSSSATLELAIEEAIQKAAPDVVAIEAEGVQAAPLLQLEDRIRSRWVEVRPQVGAGGSEVVDVGGRPVLMTRLTQGLYAYRPTCPACGASLAPTAVDGGFLECGCGTRFDIRRAGRSADGHQLEPVPLLHDGNGGVKVAVA